MASNHSGERESRPRADGLPAPHGGRLIDAVIPAADRAGALAAARSMPQLIIDDHMAADLALIARGAYSPLTGFMNRDEYEAVVEGMHLPDGLPWPLPVTLTVGESEAQRLAGKGEAALCRADGTVLGSMRVADVYRYNKRREAHYVYGTDDPDHPGVHHLYRQGDLAVGGPVSMLPADDGGDPYSMAPAETRAWFAGRGWQKVVGFQTRNPVHRAHEYIQKCALEMSDGLLLHPLTGPTREEDLAPEVRMRSYEVVIHNYYPAGRVLLAAFPAPMHYAGPREAVFHALVRKNYGCSHFIVGRDHAGVGDYYGPHDSQLIFDRFPPGSLGIVPLFFEHAFYCRACGGMATSKTCPHDQTDHVHLSGTEVRTLLRAGQTPPPEFSRPEVARLLRADFEDTKDTAAADPGFAAPALLPRPATDS